MSDAPLFLDRPDRPHLAYRRAVGAGPLLVFLPGYMSDMAGGKAIALFDWAVSKGRNCLLLDYAGCGQSDGRFADQTLADWRDDVLDLIAASEARSVVLVGSSMGGWLMLLVALALGDRALGLVGIAAAPDFTEWGFSDGEKAVIATEGLLQEATPYSDQPYVTTRAFWTSGQANRLLAAPIALSCPVRLLHGELDADVPPAISHRLMAALASEDVQLTLVKGGDHRLSRDGDIALLIATVDRLISSLS